MGSNALGLKAVSVKIFGVKAEGVKTVGDKAEEANDGGRKGAVV